MTDNSLVIKELMALLSMTEDEADNYKSLVEYAVNCVMPTVKEGVDENDARIVHLCAVKVYYQLALTQNDFISSFSAGEVSYSTDTSMPSRARALLDDALCSCADLINGSDFAFRVV